MDDIAQTIQRFDEHISDAHLQIQELIQRIDSVDVQIKKKIDAFQSEVSKQQIVLSSSNTYEKELQQLLANYQIQCNTWCNAINEYMLGQQFIDQFEKSILVVVFGNVNVGKSSIGNFIAGVTDVQANHNTTASAALNKYLGNPPAFFQYDLAQKEETPVAVEQEIRCFKEGYVETTASIQYFTRNEGLTWTDSPGVCSVTQENGNLAKKYVEFADLVVFVTSSSSPAKNDEIQELKKLFGKKKSVLLLINKSDYIDKDEVDGAIVRRLCPKSATDRKKQEEYIREAFLHEADDIISEISAISVSTHLAIQALENNSATEFEKSGFPRFMDYLGNLCSQQAIHLKMDAPRQRVNAMIDKILNGGFWGQYSVAGITQYQEALNQELVAVKHIKERLLLLAQDVSPEIQLKVIEKSRDIIHDASKKIRSENIQNSIQVDAIINQLITQECQKKLQEVFQSVLSDYNCDFGNEQNIAYQSVKGGEVCANLDTIKRTEYEVTTVHRNPQGILEHVEHFIFDKSFYKSKLITHTVTESFVNGDNADASMKIISECIGNTIFDYISNLASVMTTTYFDKECEIIQIVMNLLNTLKSELKEEILHD